METRAAPFYLRRVKEALVTFPDPETGEVQEALHQARGPHPGFELDDDEFDFYDALTRYVEDQSIQGGGDNSARGRALGFTMAMLQRRLASSVYAVRRSLERMRDQAREDPGRPGGVPQEQIEKRFRTTSTSCPRTSRRRSWRTLEDVVASIDPADLREEIAQLAADRPGPRPGGTSNRDQAHQAARGPDRAGHLQRPEDEAAPVHRAQGHARLPGWRRPGRPAARASSASGA